MSEALIASRDAGDPSDVGFVEYQRCTRAQPMRSLTPVVFACASGESERLQERSRNTHGMRLKTFRD